MRIAHLSDCYLPRLGGIETQVRALALRQAAAGEQVRVLTATPGQAGVVAGTDVVDGLPVDRLAVRLPLELPVHPQAGRAVTAALRAHPVDVVHVHTGVVSPFAWSGLRAARRLGLPVLVTVHSVWGPGARPAYRTADALVAWSRWGALLSAVSGVAADRVSSVVGAGQPVLVVPNGIDPDRWQVDPVPARPGVFRVAAVMRLAPRKRVLPLLRMLRAAAAALSPDVRLQATVVGDGPELGRARRWVAGHGLAEVIDLPGRRDQAGVRAVFAASDAFVQPSVRESFGLAALEARTAGLPVVARTQTGSSEFVHDGVEGLLARDDAGLVAGLVRLGRDLDLRAAIAGNNRAVPPDQTWPRVLAVVRSAYRQAGDVR